MEASDVVIWSADVDRETLLRVLSTDGLPLKYVKIDRLGLLKMGIEIIPIVQDMGYQVFADAKLVEIPDKLVALAEVHMAYKPWMLNCMAGSLSSGKLCAGNIKELDGNKRFADTVRAAGGRPCAVSVLTSKTDDMVRNEFNKRSPIEQVLYYAEQIHGCGFTDLVCSPLEARAIRQEARFDSLELNTPGIRLPGSSRDDQARVNTPAAAISDGVNRLVIGRDLTNGDILENLQKITDNLNEIAKEPCDH